MYKFSKSFSNSNISERSEANGLCLAWLAFFFQNDFSYMFKRTVPLRDKRTIKLFDHAE